MADFLPVCEAETLQDAFRLFNELSRSLTESYRELEAQVSRLTQELTAARGERLKTLIEKEKLANRLQRLVEALPGGIIVVDGQGEIIEYNALAAEIVGQALASKRWEDVLQQMLLSGKANPHQFLLKNGRAVNLSIRSLVEYPGQIVLLTDVTEMRALQDLVDQQKRLSAMGEMAASMAHQVRTPLAAAILYTSHLNKGGLTQAQHRRFAQKLMERLRHLERQISDMLIFAKQGHYERNKLSSSAFLSRVVDAMQPLLDGGEARLAVFDRSQCRYLFGNEDALHGVLLNLLTNALEATGGKGRVSLVLSQPDARHLEIEVADNGPGMPDAIRERIFEPFFTTKPSGTGLGLAVVDWVVRAHGGKVWSVSAPGDGTAFHILLPLAEAMPLPGGFSGQYGDLQT